MAATQYQIFFRYVNPSTNIPVTNDLINDYTETVEIIHQKHKLFAGTAAEQLEAEQERDNLIINANSPTSCDKYDMIFAFDGVEKIYHKDWVQSNGDMPGYWTPDITSMTSGSIQIKGYGGDAIKVDVPDPVEVEYKESGKTKTRIDYHYPSETGVDMINTQRKERIMMERQSAGHIINKLKPQTWALADDTMYPYVVKDKYLRVPMSPWIKGPRYGSLEAAITKCKSLVTAIGINNIKLVKLVNIVQKIKIQ